MSEISIQSIKDKLNKDSGVRYRKIRCGRGELELVYVDNLCDTSFISQYIVTPLMEKVEHCDSAEAIEGEVITAAHIGYVQTEEEALNYILNANVVIFSDFFDEILFCEAKGFEARSIDIPPTETVIKGPREGFTEIMSVNVSMIRRRIATPDLKFEALQIGEESKTKVTIAYVEGVAPPELIEYAKNKIQSMNKDFIIYGSYIEEKLKEKNTPFETIGYTEKPDVASVKLAEGRVIVIVDGTPFVIFIPFFFIENFHTTDDYNLNKFVANSGVLIRWGSFMLSTLIPGLYIALFTYNFSLVPSVFIFRMAASRAGVPFPMIIEVLIMVFFFQVLREAGIRLPQPIGPTLSIVGALILGDAAVRSGLTSQVTVLITALASIGSYLVPKSANAVFIWSLVLMVFASMMGLPGFYMGFVLYVSHLAGLTTCGYPYLYPLGTLKKFKYHDIVFRGDLESINSDIFNEGGKHDKENS